PIYTVRTTPSDTPGPANTDFVIFPPRWLVAQDTFRPPWFHLNVASEFMGLVPGAYAAKADGFVPGGCSLHNCMSGHGPDAATFETASSADLSQPDVISGTMAFMFETRAVLRPTAQAIDAPHRQRGYLQCSTGPRKHFNPTACRRCPAAGLLGRAAERRGGGTGRHPPLSPAVDRCSGSLRG